LACPLGNRLWRRRAMMLGSVIPGVIGIQPVASIGGIMSTPLGRHKRKSPQPSNADRAPAEDGGGCGKGGLGLWWSLGKFGQCNRFQLRVIHRGAGSVWSSASSLFTLGSAATQNGLALS
jgi:hypothetical protein